MNHTINFDDNHFFSHFGEIMQEAMMSESENSPYFIGMMSGTSLDGMDAVLCQFYDTGEIELLDSVSVPFPQDLRLALLSLTLPNKAMDFIEENQLAFESELDLYGWASVFYAEFASGVVKQLLQKSMMNAVDIHAIGCHGQTVRHRPHWHFSLQLLDPNILAERTGISVVSDFRRRDMAVGGQGAPLVPAFHEALFRHTDAFVGAVLNLGGIANLTIFDQDGDVLGFDVGVANLLLDGWCERHTGQSFDKDGAWAKSGKVIDELLVLLLAHPFFAKDLPKSTGREEFNIAWLDYQLAQYVQMTGRDDVVAQDVQATLAELVAISVARELAKFVFNNKMLVVCGGGALNLDVLARLRTHLSDWTIKTSACYDISPILVESMAFAWLARQAMLGKTSNLPSVTGAKRAVVLGQICLA